MVAAPVIACARSAVPHLFVSYSPPVWLCCIRTLAVKKEDATRRLLASFAPRTELNTNVASAADLVLQMKKVHFTHMRLTSIGKKRLELPLSGRHSHTTHIDSKKRGMQLTRGQ